jgi:hypothetical protein
MSERVLLQRFAKQAEMFCLARLEDNNIDDELDYRFTELLTEFAKLGYYVREEIIGDMGSDASDNN